MSFFSRVYGEAMSQICPNCGHELRDVAKYCGRCGIKLGQEQKKIYQDAGRITSLNKQSLQAKELLKAQARAVGSKNKDFVNSVKDFSNQPKKKKRGIIIALSSLAVVLLIVIGVAIFGGFGVSDDTVSQAALDLAEQDFGYKLTLTSYDIVDSFTAKGSSPLTGKFKGKAYLVIVEADALDSSGNVAMSVKYGVEVIDPEKKGDYVSYSPFSQAVDCTGQEDSAIIKYLKEATAGQR